MTKKEVIKEIYQNRATIAYWTDLIPNYVEKEDIQALHYCVAHISKQTEELKANILALGKITFPAMYEKMETLDQ